MRMIDADALSKAMYESAFEKDSDEQKWDGGCWIRYKMFERNISNAPTIDAAPVVRCKDCKECYFASNRVPTEQCYACGKHGTDVSPEWFCADGERD